jgi:hypothetical protein
MENPGRGRLEVILHNDADALAPGFLGERSGGIASLDELGADMDMHVDDALAVDSRQRSRSRHGALP